MRQTFRLKAKVDNPHMLAFRLTQMGFTAWTGRRHAFVIVYAETEMDAVEHVETAVYEKYRISTSFMNVEANTITK